MSTIGHYAEHSIVVADSEGRVLAVSQFAIVSATSDLKPRKAGTRAGAVDQLVFNRLLSSNLGNAEDPTTRLVMALMCKGIIREVRKENQNELTQKYGTITEVDIATLKQDKELLEQLGIKFEELETSELPKLIDNEETICRVSLMELQKFADKVLEPSTSPAISA